MQLSIKNLARASEAGDLMLGTGRRHGSNLLTPHRAEVGQLSHEALSKAVILSCHG